MSELGRFVAPRIETLIQRWMQQVAERLAPEGSSAPVIRDHVADVLRALVASLDRGVVPDSVVVAREHGKQRYRAGFPLTALVREYGILRGLVLDLAAEASLTRPLEEVRLVTDFMSVAVAEGVAEYEAYRTDDQRQREQLETDARLLSDSALTAGAVGTFTWDIAADRVYGDASFGHFFDLRAHPSERLRSRIISRRSIPTIAPARRRRSSARCGTGRRTRRSSGSPSGDGCGGWWRAGASIATSAGSRCGFRAC